MKFWVWSVVRQLLKRRLMGLFGETPNRLSAKNFLSPFVKKEVKSKKKVSIAGGLRYNALQKAFIKEGAVSTLVRIIDWIDAGKHILPQGLGRDAQDLRASILKLRAYNMAISLGLEAKEGLKNMIDAVIEEINRSLALGRSEPGFQAESKGLLVELAAEYAALGWVEELKATLDRIKDDHEALKSLAKILKGEVKPGLQLKGANFSVVSILRNLQGYELSAVMGVLVPVLDSALTEPEKFGYFKAFMSDEALEAGQKAAIVTAINNSRAAWLGLSFRGESILDVVYGVYQKGKGNTNTALPLLEAIKLIRGYQKGARHSYSYATVLHPMYSFLATCSAAFLMLSMTGITTALAASAFYGWLFTAKTAWKIIEAAFLFVCFIGKLNPSCYHLFDRLYGAFSEKDVWERFVDKEEEMARAAESTAHTSDADQRFIAIDLMHREADELTVRAAETVLEFALDPKVEVITGSQVWGQLEKERSGQDVTLKHRANEIRKNTVRDCAVIALAKGNKELFTKVIELLRVGREKERAGVATEVLAYFLGGAKTDERQIVSISAAVQEGAPALPALPSGEIVQTLIAAGADVNRLIPSSTLHKLVGELSPLSKQDCTWMQFSAELSWMLLDIIAFNASSGEMTPLDAAYTRWKLEGRPGNDSVSGEKESLLDIMGHIMLVGGKSSYYGHMHSTALGNSLYWTAFAGVGLLAYAYSPFMLLLLPVLPTKVFNYIADHVNTACGYNTGWEEFIARERNEPSLETARA